MRTSTKNLRTTFQLVLSEEEELAIVRRANYYGVSKTAYIKMVVMQHARSKIEELATFK
tara:strand:+ start:886 stop:1062 length:177 start_codon:yes stop_codon:yes gene_type:complete